MTVLSSLLIGSDPNFPDQDVTIDASPEVVSASLTGIYVDHSTTALSLLDQFVAAMTSAGVASPAAVILESGKVRISSSGNFTVTWDDQHLADMLGFSGSSLSGASSYTADEISKYVWFPGRGHTPLESPIGVGGVDNYLRQQTIAPGGLETTYVHATTHTTETLKFELVPCELYWTPNADGGEFYEFWKTVMVPGAKFQHYEYVNFNSTSTTPLSLSGALGPYTLKGSARTHNMDRNNAAPRVEKYYDVQIPMLGVPEYS